MMIIKNYGVSFLVTEISCESMLPSYHEGIHLGVIKEIAQRRVGQILNFTLYVIPDIT